MRLGRYIAREARAPQPGHNICGVLIHADPARMLPVCDALAEMPGVELHEQSDDGRLVVIVEDSGDTPAIESMSRLHGIPGIAAVSLVYHHCETDEPSDDAEENVK